MKLKDVYIPQTDKSDTAEGESVIRSHTSSTKLPKPSNSLVGGIACQQARKGQIELHLEDQQDPIALEDHLRIWVADPPFEGKRGQD